MLTEAKLYVVAISFMYIRKSYMYARNVTQNHIQEFAELLEDNFFLILNKLSCLLSLHLSKITKIAKENESINCYYFSY